MSETSSLSALCDFKKSDVGASLMGRPIRFDEASGLLSVKDAIEVIEGISPEAAKRKMQRFIINNTISEGANTGFEIFKSGQYKYVIFAILHGDKSDAMYPSTHTEFCVFAYHGTHFYF